MDRHKYALTSVRRPSYSNLILALGRAIQNAKPWNFFKKKQNKKTNTHTHRKRPVHSAASMSITKKLGLAVRKQTALQMLQQKMARI